MGLLEIQKEIEQQAKGEIASIEQGTKDIIASIESETKATLARTKKEHSEQLKALEKKLSSICDAEIQSDATHIALDKKQALIDEVLSDAQAQLCKNSKKYLPKLLAKAKKQIDVSEIQCNKSDASNFSEKTTIVPLSGGIVAQTKMGDVSVDLCYDTLLAQIKEKKLQEIAQILF